MLSVKVAEDRSLLDDALSVHRGIPEFQHDPHIRDQWLERLDQVQQSIFLVAYVDQCPAGYLIGYERYNSYYIWLAGVLPSYRRQGLLVQLLQPLEQWAIQKQYPSLTIKTRNSFKSMLLFLIVHDFKLIDIDKRDSVDSHRLVLKKELVTRK